MLPHSSETCRATASCWAQLLLFPPQLELFADHLQIALRILSGAHVHPALLLDRYDLHIAQQLHGLADRLWRDLIL